MEKVLFMAIATMAITGCGFGKANAREDGGMVESAAADSARASKTLIVFFSHAGDNYAVGNISVGNTKIMAGYIKELTGADVFEIVAEKSYDMPYDHLTALAKEEQTNGELPAYKGKIDDISRYDTIFVGGPVWWGTYPQVMFTFFKDYDLNGKTIIPFTTHEGSGLGNVVSDLKRLYPNADVTHPLSLYGHEARSAKKKVKKWIEGM